MPKIIALVGLPGSGKSAVAGFLEELNFEKIKLGDITNGELKKRNLEINESNEKIIRDELRKQHGMGAYAKLVIPKIKQSANQNIVLDDIISFEEVQYLKKEFKDNIIFLAIRSDTDKRIERLQGRKERPLTAEEIETRDKHQLEHLNMIKSLESADYQVMNNGTLAELKDRIITLLQKKGF